MHRLMLTHAKVLVGLTSVPLATEEQGASTGGRASGELIERQGFSSSIQDALLCTASEPKSSDGDRRELVEANIVCDGSNDDDNFSLVARRRCHLLGHSRERDGWAVDFRHEETLQDGLVKRCVGAPGQETIELRWLAL